MSILRHTVILVLLAACSSAGKKAELDPDMPLLAIRGVEIDRMAYNTSVCMEAINAGTNQSVQFWGATPPNIRQKKVMDLFSVEYAKLIKDADDGSGSADERTKTYALENKKLMQLLKLYAPKLANGCLSRIESRVSKCMNKKKSKRPEQRACIQKAVDETTEKYLKSTDVELRALK